MKYERTKNNVPVDIDTIREQDRKVGNALSYALSTVWRKCVQDFQKEATKFMKAAGIPEREIRWAVSNYSGKLKNAILDLQKDINKEFKRELF